MAKLDLIVYGATGFTGGLVAEYLVARPGLSTSRWGLAGRNRPKLEAVRDRLSQINPEAASLSIHVADADARASLDAMAAAASVILTTVGPYAEHGPPLVAACVAHGTDYVDLTGEPGFWRAMIDAHHTQAEQNGALIVPCCGFDSIPHDLGAWLVVQALREHGVRGPIACNGYVAAKGRLSGGTWQSLLGILASAPLRRPSAAADDHRPSGVHFAEDVARWVVPMPTIDPMVVSRSAALAEYPQGFGYRAWIEMGSRAAALGVLAAAVGGTLAVKVPAARRLLSRVLPSGAGPTPEQRAKSWFRVKVVGRGGDAVATASISGGDPGYGETAKMIAESALCLATQRDALPMRGGLATPAAAMGGVLVARLREAGLKITVTTRT